MVTVHTAPDTITEALSDLPPGLVAIAGYNTPRHTTISGDPETIATLTTNFRKAGIRVTTLETPHAYHSPHIDPILDELHNAAATLTYRPPTIPIISTLTGAPANAEDLQTARYWTEQARQPVRFTQAITQLAELGATNYLELGPDHTLSTLTHHTLSALASTTTPTPTITSTLKPEHPETTTYLTALAHHHTTNTKPIRTLTTTPFSPITPLPTYAFQRKRYWLEDTPATTADVASAGLAPTDHPLLGAAVALADSGTTVFTGRLSLATHPWLADHAISGTALLPGAAFVELALHAAERLGAEQIDELTLHAPQVKSRPTRRGPSMRPASSQQPKTPSQTPATRKSGRPPTPSR
jgi:acyl transferase domain-containing protein